MSEVSVGRGARGVYPRINALKELHAQGLLIYERMEPPTDTTPRYYVVRMPGSGSERKLAGPEVGPYIDGFGDRGLSERARQEDAG